MKKYLISFSVLLFSLFSISIMFPAKAAETIVPANADIMINKNSPDTTYGAAWYGIVGNDVNGDKCILVKFEDINLPPEGILDKATLKFYLFDSTYSNDTTLQVGPNDATPPFDHDHEYSTSWNNSPDRINDYEYMTYKDIDMGVENKDVEITKTVNAWLTGDIENNGIYICTAPSQPQTYFKIYMKEYSDADKRIRLSLAYHAATLGEPVHEEESSETLSFNLISPDGETLANPPYNFRWEDPNATDPAREHLTIIVNKKNEDDATTEVIKEDIPIVWTHYESSVPLVDADYEWYIEAYDMNGMIYSTPHKEFTINHNADVTDEDSQDTASSDESADNSNTQDLDKEKEDSQVSGTSDNNNAESNVSSISSRFKDSGWMIGAISFILGIIVALIIYLVYKKKQEAEKKADKKSNEDKGSKKS